MGRETGGRGAAEGAGAAVTAGATEAGGAVGSGWGNGVLALLRGRCGGTAPDWVTLRGPRSVGGAAMLELLAEGRGRRGGMVAARGRL